MDRESESDEEEVPLLSESDHKEREERKTRDDKTTTNKKPFLDDEKPSEDVNDNKKSLLESDVASPKDKTESSKGRSSRFRKKKRSDAKGSREDTEEPEEDHQPQKKKDMVEETEEEQEHENDDDKKEENEGKSGKEKTPEVRNRNSCMPVVSCLSSCLGGVGLGFRKNDSDNEGVVDIRMWDIISNTKSFKNAEDSAFCIKINRLSDLQGNLGSAVKPFVKLHIVDRETGHYIRPATTGKTSVSKSAPLLTRQASLRGTSSDIAEWNEELCFPNLSFRDAVSPRNLLLFEVLDDPPSLSFRKAQSINSAKDMGSMIRTYTTLAWAFLLPVGQKVNVGYPKSKNSKTDDPSTVVKPSDSDIQLRLQLYEYKFDNIATRIQRAANRWPVVNRMQQKRRKSETLHRYPDSIPEVFFQYKRRQQDMLPSVIEISSGCRAPIEAIKSEMRMDAMDNDGDTQKHDLDPRSSQAQEDIVKAQLRAAKLKRSRAVNEPCVIPNKLLHRLDGGPEGGMVVSFSHKGHLLAVSGAAPCGGTAGSSSVPFAPVGGTSPYGDKGYAVRLFDPDTGVEVWSDLFAHFGVVYDIKWSLTDTFFVTCSSDGCCKVWKFPKNNDDNNPSQNSGGNSPSRRSSKQNRRRSSLAGIGIQASVALAAFQEAPSLVATLAHNPPVYVYASIFQEYGINKSDGAVKSMEVCPPIITGAADGRIRVWKGSSLSGDLIVGDGDGKRSVSSSSRLRRGSICENDIDTEYRVDAGDVPHYGAKVQALAIDVRSKYLFSGDSRGQILIWRPNNSGWYSLLRKFRKDDLHGRSISSLTVYPDSAKGFLLVMALPSLVDAPAIIADNFNNSRRGLDEQAGSGKILTSALLKLYDLGTYRAQHSFPGIVINNTFCRANLSADGRYAACGTIIRNHDGVEKNHIRVWDTLTGRHQDTKISSLPLSFLPRAVSWHPKQHVLAVSMVGYGAAVSVYCADKARNEDVVHDFDPKITEVENPAPEEQRKSPTVMLATSPGRLKKFRNTMGKGADEKNNDEGAVEIRTKEQRAARTREILDRIKAAKARARGEQLS